jgi:hypothetical protein
MSALKKNEYVQKNTEKERISSLKKQRRRKKYLFRANFSASDLRGTRKRRKNSQMFVLDCNSCDVQQNYTPILLVYLLFVTEGKEGKRWEKAGKGESTKKKKEGRKESPGDKTAPTNHEYRATRDPARASRDKYKARDEQ